MTQQTLKEPTSYKSWPKTIAIPTYEPTDSPRTTATATDNPGSTATPTDGLKYSYTNR